MAIVYLIPSQLSEEGIKAVHPYTIEAIKNCSVFFCENQRTSRRFFKQLWKQYASGDDIIIDNFEWHDLKDEQDELRQFRELLKKDKSIGLISEAGCPGIADPGQLFTAIAHEMNVKVVPLVGPSSILLALMASGLNGQQFQFLGYLPIDANQRIKAIRDLETESAKKKSTQIFIETPYRNNQLLESILKTCSQGTRLCIAIDITGSQEMIQTKSIAEWKKNIPAMPKRPAMFLLLAGN